MIRTLIIDDEPAIRKDLEFLLSKQKDFMCMGSCGSVHDALVLINSTQPDLVLLDIQLSDGTSFDLLAQLKSVTFKIIFITAYNDRAISAIKYGALDYLVKPVDEEEFVLALQKVKESKDDHQILDTQYSFAKNYLQNSQSLNRIALKSQEYLQIVHFDEIVYCQSNAGYTTFHLTDNRKILISKSLKEYEELLPEQIFLRPHQSYLVNQKFIDRYLKDGLLVLKNGMEIPVSTRKRDYVMSTLTGKFST